MSDYLRHYVDWALSDIIFVSTLEKELGNAYGRELTWETIVARKGKGYVKVVLRHSVSFSPGAGGHNIGMESETPITADEYRKEARGKQILDTAAAVDRLKQAEGEMEVHYARQTELRAKRAPLQDKLDKLKPKCRKCDREMELKTKNGRQFWACRFFTRDCEGDFQNLTAEQNRILAQLAEIG